MMESNEDGYVKRKRMRDKNKDNLGKNVMVLKKIKGGIDKEIRERCVGLGEFKRRLVGSLNNFRKRNKIVFSTNKKDKTMSIFQSAQSKENEYILPSKIDYLEKNTMQVLFSSLSKSEIRKIPVYTKKIIFQSSFHNQNQGKDYQILLIILILWFIFISFLYITFPQSNSNLR